MTEGGKTEIRSNMTTTTVHADATNRRREKQAAVSEAMSIMLEFVVEKIVSSEDEPGGFDSDQVKTE